MFHTIAQLYPVSAAGTAFGDTDHDLKNEIFMYVNDTYTYHYRILENQGGRDRRAVLRRQKTDPPFQEDRAFIVLTV